jgi:hypothetical protein
MESPSTSVDEATWQKRHSYFNKPPDGSTEAEASSVTPQALGVSSGPLMVAIGCGEPSTLI